VDALDDAGAWLATQLQAQKAFLYGVVFMLIAIAMRRNKILRPEDTVPLSKVTFQMMFPALLLVNISKAPISFDLWRVAATSVCTHAVLIAIVVCFSRFVSQDNGLRGQWMFCMMGCNTGFTYPILLSVPRLANTIFPVVVIWDISGNMWVSMVIDYIVAIYFSPLDDDSQSLTEQTQQIVASQTNALYKVAVSPSTVGVMSDTGASLGKDTKSADAGDVEGVPGICINETQDLGSQPSPIRKSMAAPIAQSAMMEAGITSSTAPQKRKGLGLRVFVARLFTNLSFLAVLTAAIMNLSGVHFPTQANDFLQTAGQPFSVLFFFLLGLNMVWSVIRPRLGLVAWILLARMAIHAFLAAVIWNSQALPNATMRQGVIFGLCCPVPGMVMSYAIDLGYSRGLQAAVQTCSNATSLVVLWCLLSMS